MLSTGYTKNSFPLGTVFRYTYYIMFIKFITVYSVAYFITPCNQDLTIKILEGFGSREVEGDD